MPRSDHARPEPAKNPDHEQSANTVAVILVVDDDAINLMAIEQMLGTSGFPVVCAIREQSAGRCPKIVAVTANVTDRQREACGTAGFDGFLAEPVDMEVLPATVGELMA